MSRTHLVLPLLVGALVGYPGIGAIVLVIGMYIRRDGAASG